MNVTITDVNDNAPQLADPFVIEVAEGTAPSVIGQLNATDVDLGLGGQFTYSMVGVMLILAKAFTHI